MDWCSRTNSGWSPRIRWTLIYMLVLGTGGSLLASGGGGERLDLTNSFVGLTCLIVFFLSYLCVIFEEQLHMAKSKPVLFAAGVVWGIVALTYARHGLTHAAEAAARHNLLEYAELMLFLMVAMTYISAMTERRVFEALRAWIVNKGFGFRSLFWITGVLSFFISPIADNLTTALMMGAVCMAVGGNNQRFAGIACVNIVVAANAGGAFSPFGDITTLMVWQKGLVEFTGFLHLFIPSVVNYLVPAAIMFFFLPNEKPAAVNETVEMKRGARRIVLLFLLTIATAVCFHNFLHLPPVLGMMMGMGYLQFFGFFLKKTLKKSLDKKAKKNAHNPEYLENLKTIGPFDVFSQVARSEWDTLLFFYGVVMCVGGLGFIGYLESVSRVMYTEWGATNANIMVGFLSAIVDNIPVMFAVLTMLPDMSLGQWLLVTLTAGCGGSMLSIGSAAGVALMGQAKGRYTFFGHLKWMPAIALGYAASIVVHFIVNARFFEMALTAR